MILKHTEEFDLAYRFVNETNRNIFLTGKAGTGKTTFLKYLRENSLKKCIVAAPTGVAAINARGITLHSLFQLPFGIILPQQGLFRNNAGTLNDSILSRIHYNKKKLDLLRSIDLLIIDEASMVASYTVDAIDTILRYVKRQPVKPFGGVQVLFIGDLYQLPPVVRKDEWEILKQFYSSIFFFDSSVLKNNKPVIIELKEIFRQKDNKFIEILNGIRNNNISEENFNLLNTRINSYFSAGDLDEYIILTTHNYQSDEINQRKLKGISNPTYFFQADVVNDFPEYMFPADKELKLKIGAQVMFLKNDLERKQYFNGKLGVVTELGEKYIKVKCKDNTYEIEVKKSEWQNVSYKIAPETNEIKEEVLGSFIQYPLRLAWAITIHKSQGLTFDKIIIDAEKAFAKGQVYVALSRCTSLDGLVLKTPLYRNSLGPHKDFKEWKSNNNCGNLPQLFAQARQNFILDELQNIFSFNNWYFALKSLNELLLENQEEIKPESISWIIDLTEKQRTLNQISEKFKGMLLRSSTNNSSIEENEFLQLRIKKTALYFNAIINKWRESFNNHPLKIETKKLSRKIDSRLEEINLILEDNLQKIKHCSNGFILDNYLKSMQFFNIELNTDKKVKSSYRKKIRGSTIQETIDFLNEGKSIEQIAAARNLTVGTIESHLSRAIRQDLIQLEDVIPLNEAEEIAEHFPKRLYDCRLPSIKEKLPPDISYGKLRLILAWLQKTKANNDF